ncbi:MAG: sprT domain-containing protein [Clostridiales bacterium]|nr:sprT domain-containing protein [Clostridiales bacterium]
MVKKENLDALLKQVIKEVRDVHIPLTSNICEQVLVNPRPRRRFGCCRRQGGKFIIEISEFILGGHERAVKGVLAHEVLHACKGSYEHGAVWKKYRDIMNQAYGYNIKRTTSFEEMGLPEISIPDNKVKYIIRCQKCGKEYHRQKFTCVMKKINAYRCRCGGKLEWIKIEK